LSSIVTMKRIWEVYFCIHFFFVAKRTFFFFTSHSPVNFYFFILNSFHPYFQISYGAAFSQILLDIAHLVPLFLYITRQRLWDPQIWQALFLLRIIFDIIGHPYEIHDLMSLYHYDPQVCLKITLLSVSAYIPSYIACFQYAFNQKKLFAQRNS